MVWVARPEPAALMTLLSASPEPWADEWLQPGDQGGWAERMQFIQRAFIARGKPDRVAHATAMHWSTFQKVDLRDWSEHMLHARMPSLMKW